MTGDVQDVKIGSPEYVTVYRWLPTEGAARLPDGSTNMPLELDAELSVIDPRVNVPSRSVRVPVRAGADVLVVSDGFTVAVSVRVEPAVIVLLGEGVSIRVVAWLLTVTFTAEDVLER
jgi:hypothetical protein